MIWVVQGDCREVLATWPENSISAVVTDPPYELGFMGKGWDKSGVAFDPATWTAVLRVLKPGGHMLAFSGTRTYHRMVCAIEDAGFEIRDQLAWLYGTGFPKSKNVAMSIDKGEGVIGHRSVAAVTVGVDDCSGGRGPDRDVGAYKPEPGSPGEPWAGWGTALKPAQEPIVLARKPLIGTVAANVLAHGTGALNIDACRIGSEVRYNPPVVKGWNPDDTYTSRDAEGSMVSGRWPANVLFDEDAAAVLDQQSGVTTSPTTTTRGAGGQHGITSPRNGQGRVACHADTGGASRFFYVAKASRAERECGLEHLPLRSGGELTDRVDGSDGLNSPRAGAGRNGGRRNHHPTVKPIDLMRYLIRMITPPGGIVLDPFAGSGSTLVAAKLEDVRAVGIELTPEYIPIIEGRIAGV